MGVEEHSTEQTWMQEMGDPLLDAKLPHRRSNLSLTVKLVIAGLTLACLVLVTAMVVVMHSHSCTETELIPPDHHSQMRQQPRYTTGSVASFASLREPAACIHWRSRCLYGAQRVAEAAANHVEYLQANFFGSELCTGAFSCQNRQKAWHVPSQTYAPMNTSTIQAQYLVLHLPGTGTSTLDQTNFTATAADAGFYVLSLSYSSWPFAVANSDAYCMSFPSNASGCNMGLHESVIFGSTTDSLWAVPQSESIQNLATEALQTLSWHQFLGTGGTVDWKKVIVTGHSQGASHAAYMSTKLPLAAAVLLSGPQEIVAASWMRSLAYPNTTRRAMFAKRESCGEDPLHADRYCGVYQRATNTTLGILYRNLNEFMNLTAGIVGNNSFFMQNFRPTNLHGLNKDLFAYHDSNAFDFAPLGVKVLWKALFEDLIQ